MKKILLIVNPIAGKRHATDYLPQITKKFENAGYEVETRYTEIDENATAVTLKHGEGKDLIVCLGGDGTLKENICGVMAEKLSCKIGYIPLGTTNDFAHSLNIPTDALKAADAVINGIEMPIDIGDFGGKEQFMYVSCFGNFCDVSYKAKQSLKNKIGRGAYYWETVKDVPKLKGYKARIECDDGEVFEGNFFYGGVSNSYSIAGFPVLKNAGVKFDDGMHELALIRMPKNPAQLASLLRDLFIKKDVFHNDCLVVKRGKSFKFSFDEPVDWTLDGEHGGIHSEVEITTKEHAVRIMAAK